MKKITFSNTIQPGLLAKRNKGHPLKRHYLKRQYPHKQYLKNDFSGKGNFFDVFQNLLATSRLVLEVEESLSVGSRLVVNESSNEDGANSAVSAADADSVNANGHPVSSDEGPDPPMTHHERSHLNAEDRYQQRRWPWERQAAAANNEHDEDEQYYSNKELYHKFKPKGQRRNARSEFLQKFTYSDGFISCQNNDDLVLGVKEVEGRISEVVLCKKKVDEVFQRWVINENGIVESKANPNLVLTVSLPTPRAREEMGDLADMTYVGCQVILGPRKKTQFGRANQMWHYDEASGCMLAFSTDNVDKEVTAANKASVCTYAVMGNTEIDQPGFAVDLNNDKSKSKRVIVCSSCARSMRGRFKLERVEKSIDFACAMGDSKSLGVKQLGSFKCLNGKVDLSTFEAEHTLQQWESQLDKLRQELSVRAIAKEISAAGVPYTAKVLAFKNGEGRIKSGELIIASSIPGILAQCTSRLRLTQAARRLYTQDGTVILDLNDLIEWMQDHYAEQASQELKANAKEKRQALKQDGEVNGNGNLMSKVDLEEDEEEDEEDDKESNSESINIQDNSEKAFAMGYQAVNDRPFVDSWLDSIVIPNPAEEIEHDGYVVVWSLFASGAGTIFLQVFRPSKDNLNQFTLVDQLEFNTQSPGEYTVDMMSIDNARWQGKGMAVKKGDVIGFYCPGEQLIMYDKDETVNQAPLFVEPREAFDSGSTLNFRPVDDSSMRAYSLNAIIIPVDEKSSESTKGPKKPKKKKKPKQFMVEKPPVGLVLRFPMEVWVSCGEAFVKPEKVERKMELVTKHREERASVAYELEKEKHILRQLQGRRIDGLSPGTYHSTMNPQHPVLIEGHWLDPSLEEKIKHHNVHQLQTHLSEVKNQQQTKSSKSLNIDYNKSLYTQPTVRRVLVFPNGESPSRAVYVWGESIAQILHNAAQRLNIRRELKYLFDLTGNMITNMKDVERDMLLSVSSSKTFQRPSESNQNVAMKATWGRTRKQHGPQSTDIVVRSHRNPNIDVDPFGPSEIAGGPTNQFNEDDS